MGALDLAIALGNVEEDVTDILGLLRQGGPDAELVLDLCARYRQLGCGLLLSELDADGFRIALFQSGRSWLWLLGQEARLGERDAYWLCAARAAPLLDALAAGRPDLAASIGALLTRPFDPAMEAEDDHHYFRLLAGPLLRPEGPVDLLPFERALGGEPSARFDAVAALVRRDQDAFAAALAALSAEWAEGVAERRKADALDEAEGLTEAFVFVEGIALARLAAARGIPLQAPIRFVPEEVFGEPGEPFPEDFAP